MQPNGVLAPGRWVASGLTLSAAWSVPAASVALGLGRIGSEGMPPATATTWSAELPVALWRVDPCTGEDLAAVAHLGIVGRSWPGGAGLRVDARTRLALTKLLAAILLARRLGGPSEPFLVGMAGGVGFAILENMLYEAAGARLWPTSP